MWLESFFILQLSHMNVAQLKYEKLKLLPIAMQDFRFSKQC